VLTSERLLFLSSGKTGALEGIAKAALFGGMAASLMRGSMERRMAKDLDLSALETEGSWELPLAKIKGCEAQGSTFGALWFAWLGPRLVIQGEDESGTEVSFCAFRGQIKGNNKDQLRQLVNDAARQVNQQPRGASP
jgi:hypothetical protein